MSSLRNQNYKNENTSSKNSWYNWLIIYIPKLIRRRALLKTKFRVFLKQTQPRIIVNQ